MRIRNILLLLIMLICFNNNFSNVILGDEESEVISISSNELESISKYYLLIELEPTNNRRYHYELLNAAGEVLFQDTIFRLPPNFCFISQNILRVRVGAGTSVYFDKFYDVTNEKISEYFYVPYTIFKNYVVSIRYIQEENDTFLMVQDMFIKNKTYIYQKIDVANSFSPNVSIRNIKFLNDNKIHIKYESKNNFQVKEKIFSF